MPFLKAGFNARNFVTGIKGWTRPASGGRFQPAELRRFESGDYFWYGVRRGFLARGEACVLGTWPEFVQTWADDLPMSPITRPERKPISVRLVLPYPVSANRYWISFYAPKAKRVFTGPTKEAEAFKEECGWRAKAAGVRSPFTGHVELRVRLVPENKVCMDLDNALKVTVDALKGIVYEDDDQVMRIVAERADADPMGGKRVEVEVLPYSMPTELEAAA